MIRRHTQQPLRTALLHLVEVQEATGIDQLAMMAGVAEDRARAYVSTLTGGGIVVCDGDEVRPGPGWEQFATIGTRTRPRLKDINRAAVDAAYMRTCRWRAALSRNIFKAAEERGWTVQRLAIRAGVPSCLLYRLRRSGTPLPCDQTLLVAQALGISVEELAEV